MPVPAVWGPRLWKIIHSLADRKVNPDTPPLLKSDAWRELKGMLQTLELIVPCLECKKHIRIYIKSNSLPVSLSDASDWLWKFHNDVNVRLGKPFFPNPFLSDQNQNQNQNQATNQILPAWKEYRQLMKESLLLGHVKGEDLSAWERRLRLFLSLT